MTSKNLFLIMLIALSLVITGCGSKSKKGQANDEPVVASDNQDTADDDVNLELNGDSDSGKAGPLQTVFFAFNSSVLTETGKEKLEAAATFMKENESIEAQVEGHADERGGVQFNLALGERRAKSVEQYLVALGVSDSRLSTISFGKERPIAFGHGEEAWSKNRRGNFVITAK